MTFATDKALEEEKGRLCVKGKVTVVITSLTLGGTNPTAWYTLRTLKDGKADVNLLDEKKEWLYDLTWWYPFKKDKMTITGEFDTCGKAEIERFVDKGGWKFTPEAISERYGKVTDTKNEGGEWQGKITAYKADIEFGESELSASIYCKKEEKDGKNE